MAFSHYSSDNDRPPSIQTALGDIITHGHQLLINRMDLMQVELRDVGQRAVKRAVDIALAMLLTFSGFVLLTAAAVMGLAQYVGTAWSLAICGGVYTLGGLIFVTLAQKTQAADVTTTLVPDAHTAPRGSHDAN
jgi:hypothetical protein